MSWSERRTAVVRRADWLGLVSVLGSVGDLEVDGEELGDGDGFGDPVGVLDGGVTVGEDDGSGEGLGVAVGSSEFDIPFRKFGVGHEGRTAQESTSRPFRRWIKVVSRTQDREEDGKRSCGKAKHAFPCGWGGCWSCDDDYDDGWGGC